MAEVKKVIRDKELWEADVEIQDERVVKAATPNIQKLDAFFQSDDSETEQNEVHVEKRAVLRDGRVPKLAKNYEKLQQKKIEQQRRAEGWHEDEQKRLEEEKREASKIKFTTTSTIDKKPLKIKASSYGKDAIAVSQRN